jgi:hypothetical protein
LRRKGKLGNSDLHNRVWKEGENKSLFNLLAPKLSIFMQPLALVTDSENKMVAMRRQIQEQHPDMLVYGCGSHYMDKLGEKIIDETQLKHIMAIQKHFKGKQVLCVSKMNLR